MPGQRYIPGFVDEACEQELLAAIDSKPWIKELKRRVQHYGYRYDYKARKVDSSMHIGALPDWSLAIVNRLVEDALMPSRPDQLIVNEYEPGQGISAHVDCLSCFGPVICSLTLGSHCVMKFTSGSRQHALLLARRSLLVLSGAARYVWRLAIPARRNDRVGRLVVPRSRRVSLTFRTVRLGEVDDVSK